MVVARYVLVVVDEEKVMYYYYYLWWLFLEVHDEEEEEEDDDDVDERTKVDNDVKNATFGRKMVVVCNNFHTVLHIYHHEEVMKKKKKEIPLIPQRIDLLFLVSLQLLSHLKNDSYLLPQQLYWEKLPFSNTLFLVSI